MYRSSGASGYKCFRVGRTGAISVSRPWSRRISVIRRIMRVLRPWPRYSGAIGICIAQSTVRFGARSGEARFDDGVESSIGQAHIVSVPRRGNRHPHTDDFLPLVVPRVEPKLGVFGDHAAEEALQDGVVVHELGPGPLPEAGCVGEVAGPLGTSWKLQRHLGRSVSYATPGPSLGRSQVIPGHWRSRAADIYDGRYPGSCLLRQRLVSPPIALAFDVFARILAEIGRAEDEDLEALRPGLVASPRAGRDAHRVPFLELDDLVVELHPPTPAHDHVHLLLRLVCVAVRKAIAGRDALIAKAGLLELERLACEAKLQVGRAVEVGTEILEILLEVPERERHGRDSIVQQRARQDSNLWPSVP